MMMKRFEIGSEYHLDTAEIYATVDNLYKRTEGFHTIFYNSGRSAIRGVLRQLKGQRALLPSYVCQAVIQAFEQENYSVDFYNINTDLSIDLEDVKRKCELGINVFFLIHYYGTLQEQKDLTEIKELCSQRSITIIEDTTHSFLTKVHTIGDYCIASLRKWFALPDGGVAYSLQTLDDPATGCTNSLTNTRTAGMFLKGLHLKGLVDSKELYLRLMLEAEKMLDQITELCTMSDFSRRLLQTFDVEKAIQKRKQNAEFLHRNINNPLIKPVFAAINPDICPFFYPVYAEDREKVRQYLIQHHIYCPVHWPVEESRLLEFAPIKYISENVISIPIDQRYSIADMEYICNVVNGYNGGTCE